MFDPLSLTVGFILAGTALYRACKPTADKYAREDRHAAASNALKEKGIDVVAKSVILADTQVAINRQASANYNIRESGDDAYEVAFDSQCQLVQGQLVAQTHREHGCVCSACGQVTLEP